MGPETDHHWFTVPRNRGGIGRVAGAQVGALKPPEAISLHLGGFARSGPCPRRGGWSMLFSSPDSQFVICDNDEASSPVCGVFRLEQHVQPLKQTVTPWIAQPN